MLAFAAALVLRSAFNYDAVFRPDGVRYQEGDAWFHMRTVRNLMHHYPFRSGFDPYTDIEARSAASTIGASTGPQ